ncbi:MAG: caspase family protein [Phycisphaerae bacterium]|nr:caspase family protein [Gemmatimonadaceae bacterium]
MNDETPIPSESNTTAPNTYALIVGIEQHATDDWPRLNGPANDARKFANWLDSVGVPANHIALFLSPNDEQEAAAVVELTQPTVLRGAAKQAAIFDHVTEHLASRTDADLLIVYWGGHGLGNVERNRYLLYADADATRPLVFDMQSFLSAVQTDLYSGVQNLIVIVDSCATFADTLQLPATIAAQPFPRGKSRHLSHFVLYASQAGRDAYNSDDEQSGVLSRELRVELEKSEFPPPMKQISVRLIERFKQLKARGEVSQIPTYLSEIDLDGNEEKFLRDAVPRAASLGALTPKLYDRSDQDTLFTDAWQDCLENNAPLQCCIVYGKAFEQHTSFVERVIQTRVRPRIDRPDRLGRAVCQQVAEFTITANADLEFGKCEVRNKLMELSRTSKRPTNGWELIADAGWSKHGVVTFSHLIQVRDSASRFVDLINWYVKEFWQPPATVSELPKVVLFVMIEFFDGAFRRSLARPGSWFSNPREDASRALATLADKNSRRHVLPELKHLEVIDVSNWFKQYARTETTYAQNFDCDVAATKLFNDAVCREDEPDVRRTDSIEKLLDQTFRGLTANERVHRGN